MNLIQGSTYLLETQLFNEDGELLDVSKISKVEFAFGPEIIKTYPSNEVEYIENKFIVSLSQEDTFKLSKAINTQIRVLYNDGQVKSTYPKLITIVEGVSKNILW